MDVVIAAGVESMTRVPMGLSLAAAGQERLRQLHEPEHRAALSGHRVQPVHRRRDDGREVRPDQGRRSTTTALNSHQRADAATQAGAFKTEIVPLEITRADGSKRASITSTKASASTPRSKASRGVKLLPRRRPITAASASQICDGASGVMVVNERGLKALGLTPLARIHHMTVIGGDPGDHARSAAARHRARAEEGRHDDRRHRPVRGQRGLRLGAAGLAAGPPAPTRRGSTSTAAPSRSATRSARSGTKLMTTLVHALHAARQALRPADHVRRRRHGQRDHRRAAVSSSCCATLKRCRPGESRDP